MATYLWALFEVEPWDICFSPQDYIYNFRAISKGPWLRRNRKNLSWSSLPPAQHTHTCIHAANGKHVRNRGRLIIQVGRGPSYWSLDSLSSLPSFFSSPFCHLSPTIRWVGGLLAGCWLANRNSLGASVLGVCSLKDEPEQQRMIFLSMFSQFTSKESRWGDVICKGRQKFQSE